MDIFTGFSSASGHDIIYGFEPGIDQIHDDFWFAEGVCERVNLILNPHGKTILDMYAADGVVGASITLSGITQNDWSDLIFTS